MTYGASLEKRRNKESPKSTNSDKKGGTFEAIHFKTLVYDRARIGRH